MHKVGTNQYKTAVTQYKVRRESDYYIVFFPEIGEYYAANEVGVDILKFFFQTDDSDLFSFLATVYEELSDEQKQSVSNYVQKLCMMNIITKEN